MKIVVCWLLSLLLSHTALIASPKLVADENQRPFINKIGFGIGANFPFGSGVLRTGAYPIGPSMHVNLNHSTKRGHNYELVTGLDIIVDFGGGTYLALPLLINRTHQLVDVGNGRFSIDGFAGLGYYFHHIFTRTEGVTIKNQNTLGLDAGVIFNYAPGKRKRWELNLRAGVYRSFTKPVQVYFAGTSKTSENKFNYATLPVLIGVSRKIGRP